MKNIKLLYSSSLASTLAVIFVAVITILAELLPSLKTVLKDFSGHHWVSKSIFVALIYLIALAIFYLISKNASLQTIRRSLIVLVLAGAASALAIFIFFTAYYFTAH